MVVALPSSNGKLPEAFHDLLTQTRVRNAFDVLPGLDLVCLDGIVWATSLTPAEDQTGVDYVLWVWSSGNPSKISAPALVACMHGW
jgi:hypothetical protein